MFCKAIYTMRRPLFSFKYVLQGNLYNAATAVQFKVCFARQSIQCGDLCSFSSKFCKTIYTMRLPLFIFKFVFARQSLQCSDLCSLSSMFLPGNLYYAVTSVQFQICFTRQSIQCGNLVQFQVCFARQSLQCGDLCIFSSMFLQGNLYYAVTCVQFQVCFARQSIQCGDLCSFSNMFLQHNLYNKATSVQFQVCFARQSIQYCDLCSVSRLFCKAIYTMRRPLFNFKYVLQGNLYNAATSVQFQVCFARQYIHCGDLSSVSCMFCKAISTMRRTMFSFKYVLQGNLYNAVTSVQFQVCFARQSIQCGELCSV